MDNLPAAFADAAARHGDRAALIEPDGTAITFRALQERVLALTAAWSKRGLRDGDRVLLAMPVGANLYASLAAIWSLGGTVVLPEPAMGLAGLRSALAQVPVQAFCATGAYRLLHLILPALWGKRHLTTRTGRGPTPKPTCAATDIALISFTSGTTGAPKAIPRSHRFLMAQRAAVAPLLDSDRAEIDLVAFPVFVLLNLAAGRTSVLPDWPMRNAGRVTADALHGLIARHRCSRALLPPALCETLGEKPTPGCLHSVFTGGGPVFPDIVERLTRSGSGLSVVSVYGSTEAEPIAEVQARDVTPDDITRMQAGAGLLAGPPVPGIALRIEDGEIWVSGDHVVAGYLDPARDVETKRHIDGVTWHRTGDAGRLEPDGRLWLLGRHGAQVKTALGTQWACARPSSRSRWRARRPCYAGRCRWPWARRLSRSSPRSNLRARGCRRCL